MEVQENNIDVYTLENCKACEILLNNLQVMVNEFETNTDIKININVFEVKSKDVSKLKNSNIKDFPTTVFKHKVQVLDSICGSVSKLKLYDKLMKTFV